MNSIPRRVVQYWRREKMEWKRDSRLEVDVHCPWANDDD